MSTPTTPPPGGFIPSEEAFSPESVWRVEYDQMDGERSPLIVSPRVTEVRTQRVVLDFWRTCLDASVSGFTPRGFRLRVQDPYGPTEVHVAVDVAGGTFSLEGQPPVATQPLDQLEAVLHGIIEREHAERKRLPTPVPPPLDMTVWGRVKRWMRE